METHDTHKAEAASDLSASAGSMTDTEILDWLCWNGHLLGIKTENFITYYDSEGRQTDISRYSDIRKWVRSFQSNTTISHGAERR